MQKRGFRTSAAILVGLPQVPTNVHLDSGFPFLTAKMGQAQNFSGLNSSRADLSLWLVTHFVYIKLVVFSALLQNVFVPDEACQGNSSDNNGSIRSWLGWGWVHEQWRSMSVAPPWHNAERYDARWVLRCLDTMLLVVATLLCASLPCFRKLMQLCPQLTIWVDTP